MQCEITKEQKIILKEKYNIPNTTIVRHLEQGFCPWPRKSHIRDGRTKHPLYKTWDSMIGRCYHKSNASYYNYGAVGITVCDSWRKDFKNFLDDMGDKPSPQYTLDRIDNNKGYYKENCRWSTWEEQQANKKKPLGYIEIYKDRKKKYRVHLRGKKIQSFYTLKEAKNKLKELRDAEHGPDWNRNLCKWFRQINYDE